MTQAKQEQVKTQAKKQAVTIGQSILIGSIAGATEVLVDHPLWSIKTRMQRGEAFTFNPSVLYRGIVPNVASMVPITAMQVGLNSVIQRVFFNKQATVSDAKRVGSAFIAGVGSSLVSCPTEMIMTQQGKKGGSFYAASRYLVKEGGWQVLYRGLPATAMREGLFTTFFLAGTPILKAKLKTQGVNDKAASLLAGMSSGVGATIASHAFDTVKTMQQDAAVTQPVSLSGAAKKIHSTHGVYGFFKGVVPRGTRVVSAVTIMGAVAEKMEAVFQQYNTTEIAEEKEPQSRKKF